MAMVFFRASPLPRPTREYSEEQFSQMVRVLELYFSQLDSKTPNIAESYKADNFFGGFFVGGVTDAITAAGATQATATEITTASNNVTVVAAGADGVRLPTAQPGVQILVRNSDAADSLNIYPATGAQINALGANAAFSLAAGLTIQLFSTTTTQWFTF
jgi:hypothetical protein